MDPQRSINFSRLVRVFGLCPKRNFDKSCVLDLTKRNFRPGFFQKPFLSSKRGNKWALSPELGSRHNPILLIRKEKVIRHNIQFTLFFWIKDRNLYSLEEHDSLNSNELDCTF